MNFLMHSHGMNWFHGNSGCKNYKIHPMGWILLMHKCKWMKYVFLHCCQEKLGFATFRLSNSSLGSKNSSLGPSALGMNFFSLGMNYSLQVAKPNSSFLQCTKLYIANVLVCRHTHLFFKQMKITNWYKLMDLIHNSGVFHL